jgi:hypothetical protein
MKNRLLMLVAFALPSNAAFAQPAPELPDASPRARVEQKVGLTEMWVDYSSPARKGRDVWGSLVPYGQLWRTGANLNTLIHFSREATFGGTEVPAGTYGLFSIPGEDQWTVILNRETEAWGTGGYVQAKDAARVTVEPVEETPRERMTFIFSETTADSTRLDLEWAGLRVSVPIEVDTESHVMAEIEAATSRAWLPHERSARYLLEQGKDLKKAMSFIDQSIAIQANWRNLWVKARILGALGRDEEAVRTAKKAKRLGDDSGAFRFYAPQMDEAIARWKGKS